MELYILVIRYCVTSLHTETKDHPASDVTIVVGVSSYRPPSGVSISDPVVHKPRTSNLVPVSYIVCEDIDAAMHDIILCSWGSYLSRYSIIMTIVFNFHLPKIYYDLGI